MKSSTSDRKPWIQSIESPSLPRNNTHAKEVGIPSTRSLAAQSSAFDKLIPGVRVSPSSRMRVSSRVTTPVGHCLRYYRDGHLSTPLPLAGANGTIFLFLSFFFSPSSAFRFSRLSSTGLVVEARGTRRAREEKDLSHSLEAVETEGRQLVWSTERKIINNDEPSRSRASPLTPAYHLTAIKRRGGGGKKRFRLFDGGE